MLVETYDEVYNVIKDDIVSISVAIQRCQHIHEYEISTDTLQAGLSLGKSPEHILQVLDFYNKYKELPQEISEFLAPNQERESDKKAIYFQILDTEHYLLRIPQKIYDIIKQYNYTHKFTKDNYDKVPFLRYNPNCQKDRLEYLKMNIEDMIPFRENMEKIMIEEEGQNIIFLEEYYETKQITENGVYQQLPEQQSIVKNELFGNGRLNLVDVLKRINKGDDNNSNQEQQRKIMEYINRFDIKQIAFARAVIKYNKVAPVLNAKLKSTTSLRDYQRYAVMRVVNQHENFPDDKWPQLPSTNSYNSGLIILPCGSGKTLTGIAIAINVQQACLVLTNSNISSLQWKNEFKKYTTINDQNIFVFSAGNIDNGATIYQPGFHQVVISTYQMLTNTKANPKAKFNQTLIRNTLFGTILFDEAHMMFAETYHRLWMLKINEEQKNKKRSVEPQFIAAKCKIGLTATPLREDQKIEQNMKYLGVKLYEANWYELEQKGYLAPIKCIEIRVEPNTYIPKDMEKKRFLELSRGGMLHTRGYDTVDNQSYKDQEKLVKYLTKVPFSKIRVLIQLIKLHLSMSHQILIFVDEVTPAKLLARILHAPALYGEVESKEREIILDAFLQREINLIVLTRVGDTSIDLPECNVLIELSWQEGSNRQETQRMGRISRPKSSGETGYFYILVNEGAINEVRSAEGRRQYITVSQGYSYATLTEDDIKNNIESKKIQYGEQETDSSNSIYKFHEIQSEEDYVKIWNNFMQEDENNIKDIFRINDREY